MAAVGFTLGELARALGATLEGDPDRRVTGVAALASAGPGDISFLLDGRHRDEAQASQAGAFLAAPGVDGLPGPVLRVPAPREALIGLLGLFHPPEIATPGVAPSAVVSPEATVDPTATVGALAVVEREARLGPRVRLHPLVYVGRGVEIGEGSVMFPQVTLREGVRVGRRVVIHAGAVIGADGFGYVFDGAVHRKVPQVGGVRIEDDVEIGANTTIDRATVGDTVVGTGTKIDNLVQIGHNVQVGAHAIIVAQTGLSGSSRLGRRVVVGGQVGIADHVAVGDGAMVASQSGVHADLAPGAKVFGTPARPLTEAKRIHLAAARLPELVRRLRELERRLAALEARRPRSAGG